MTSTYTVGAINEQYATTRFTKNDRLSLFTVNQIEVALTPFLKRIIDAAKLPIEPADIVNVWNPDDQCFRFNQLKSDHIFEAAVFLGRLIAALLYKEYPFVPDGVRFPYNTNFHSSLLDEWETLAPPSDLPPATIIFSAFFNPLNQTGPADEVKAWVIRYKEAIRDGLQFIFELMANPHNRPNIDDRIIKVLVNEDGLLNDLYIDHKRVVDIMGLVRDSDDLMDVDDSGSSSLTETSLPRHGQPPNIPCYPQIPIPHPILHYWAVPCWDVPTYQPTQPTFVAPHYPAACHSNAYIPAQPSPLRHSIPYRACLEDDDDSDIEIITEGVRLM
jgi:hypothetical protein